MSRILYSDGLQAPVIKFDEGSIINNQTIAAATGALSLEPVFINPAKAPSLQLRWNAATLCTDFDVHLIVYNTIDAAAIAVVEVMTAIDATAADGIVLALRENAMALDVIYGQCFIQITNNDLVNDLLNLSGIVFINQ